MVSKTGWDFFGLGASMSQHWMGKSSGALFFAKNPWFLMIPSTNPGWWFGTCFIFPNSGDDDPI